MSTRISYYSNTQIAIFTYMHLSLSMASKSGYGPCLSFFTFDVIDTGYTYKQFLDGHLQIISARSRITGCFCEVHRFIVGEKSMKPPQVSHLIVYYITNLILYCTYEVLLYILSWFIPYCKCARIAYKYEHGVEIN